MVSMHSNSFFITTTNSRRQQWSLFVLLMFLGCGVESNSRLLSTSFQSDASEKTCWRSNGASIQDCRSISGIDQNSCNTACDAENFEYAIFYPYDSRCYCKCSNTSPHSLDMSVACVDNDWCTCTDKTVVPAGCVGDEGQNLDRCEDGFEVGVYFPCYNTRYPATQLSGHFSNGWQTSEGCAFECNERDDCEMYSFQFRDERADKVGHCVLFSHSAMTSGDIVEWGNPGSLKCVKKERIDTIPDLKFYLKVDDYTSGNAWVDRVSNVEVHVPGSASFHEGYVHLSGSAITAPLQTNPNYMQSVTYVIRLRVPTIPSNLGWVMSQFGDYGWSRALTISDYRLGNVGQTPGNFESGLGSFPTDSWQVLVGTWTQHGACQTFLQGTSGNPRICSNGRGTDSNEKLIIGGRMETDGNHNPQSVDISDVLVFNRVLNTDEINFITSTLSQPKQEMNHLGGGFCTSGYYAGWDSKGIESSEACNQVCLSEQQCTYAAFYAGKTCSRYNGDSCTLNSDANHITYAKQSMPNEAVEETRLRAAFKCIDGDLTSRCYGMHGDALTIAIPNSKVSKVKIVNAFNWRDKLNNAQVFVGDALCGSVSGRLSVVELDCYGITGTAVTISLENTGELLTLMEVEIFGETTPELIAENCPSACNTCQSGSSGDGGIAVVEGTCTAWCSQSGHCGIGEVYNYKSGGTYCSGCSNVVKKELTHYRITPRSAHFNGGNHANFPVSNCFDGDFSTMCANRYSYDQLYIDIPLSRVSMVKIYNRLNRDSCCQDRIENAVVSVDGVICGKILNGDAVIEIVCPDLPGKRVTISAANAQINLMEVEVYGILPDYSNERN